MHIYRSHGHDVAALSGIGITVRPGELVGLLGPSGAGKSTLLQLCGGLLTPSAGRLQIGEHNVATMTEAELDRMRVRRRRHRAAGRRAQPHPLPDAAGQHPLRTTRRTSRPRPAEPDEVLELVGLPDARHVRR